MPNKKNMGGNNINWFEGEIKEKSNILQKISKRKQKKEDQI
jgi:uncharacterized protein YacL (UPF0231 family)